MCSVFRNHCQHSQCQTAMNLLIPNRVHIRSCIQLCCATIPWQALEPAQCQALLVMALSMRAAINLAHCTCKYAASRLASTTTGTSYKLCKAFTAEEVGAFLQITGDRNPIHVDAAAAQQRGLQHAVLPGILLASLFPAIIGSRFPGAVYASQTLSFRLPALVGEQVEATVTVQRASGRRVSFATACHAADGRLLLDGTALAIMPGARDQ